MARFRLTALLSAALTLSGAGIVAFSAPAEAAPCGNGGTGSSLLSALGLGASSGSVMGSVGSSSGSAGTSMRLVGTQGPLPRFSGANTNTVAWVTGPLSANSTFNRFGISGTDLGISWDDGNGQTLMAFGDTYGFCALSDQQWRHNVLLRSNDSNLADGLSIPNGVAGDASSGASVSPYNANYAQPMISSLGIDKVEVSTIPTAAIAINGVQFVNFMSVRSWGNFPGQWVTNYSLLASSTNNGETWTTDPKTIRLNAGANTNFQQNAYVAGRDGWIYQYGTPNGRYGSVYLARFQPGDIGDQSKYQYFVNKPNMPWSPKIDDGLVPVVVSQVGEMSVAWNAYLGKYLMLRGVDDQNTVVAQTSAAPEGPWSAPVTLVPPGAIPGIYAPFIHPKSSGSDLYFTASSWGDYNVMLLHTNLAALR